MDDFRTLETDLEEARRAAHAKGWRDEDLSHSLRSTNEARDLFDHLDDGIERWRTARRLSAAQAANTARFLLVMLRSLPDIPPVGAPASVGDIDAGVLGKVRALLAKAESTEFEPEADALWAKAHELMARYSIDHAAVTAGGLGCDEVLTRRVLLDEPYAYQRFVLLAQIAGGFGCRVLGWSGIGLATVFGMPADVEATELLYTSLLLQATSSMLRANPYPKGTAASRVAAFRRAFLVAFAQRIGARLRENRRVVVEEAAAAAPGGADLLPVLARRDAAVTAAFESFSKGKRTARARTVSDARGLVAGDAAGASATLATQSRLAGRRALSR